MRHTQFVNISIYIHSLSKIIYRQIYTIELLNMAANLADLAQNDCFDILNKALFA